MSTCDATEDSTVCPDLPPTSDASTKVDAYKPADASTNDVTTSTTKLCTAGSSSYCTGTGMQWTGSQCCVTGASQCVAGSYSYCTGTGMHFTGTKCCVEGTPTCTTGTYSSCQGTGMHWTGSLCCVD